ncbi:DNA topoisomerase III [Gayadomonas joobiniege]|uniref:DNA topoisomerase III n=1 Tax=Gayadomonas joobiniege TaxID=1234606 RepID=UPI0004744C7F|nr:DNA topoisomerase III [Gayadomonas joobiniege]
MQLYIAEKPSLGRALADALPGSAKRHDGYIQLSGGDIVTWCIGHLLEQAAPDAYDPKYKKWQKQDLPIIPEQWQLTVKSTTKKQFNVVKKLIKQAQVIINVGDPDREGQILVDEVINFCGASQHQKQTALRCLISDLNKTAVQKSLAQLKANSEFKALATSALARARADWLYGMNMTRMCTLQGQNFGYQGVLSIGRVQTPVLGLVVDRDAQIDNFVSKPFYEVVATFATAKQQEYQAKWKPSDACQPYMDEEGRVLNRKLAETVVARITGKAGTIVHQIKKNSRKSPPLPHALSSLQIEAGKVFSLSAQTVLDVCQSLYEKHKLITYPRSDCRHLPSAHRADKETVTAAIQTANEALKIAVLKADLTLKSAAWNDKKVTAHHAIIPTSRAAGQVTLNQHEKNVYFLIARAYLAQFYPAAEYSEKQIDTQVEGGLFVAKQKDLIKAGWLQLYQSNHEKKTSIANLPNVKKGDPVNCKHAEVLDKQTTPPKRFTDATLLAAMTGISRYVSQADIKKVLKDTDGIGTEATRAGIIELLFKRGYLIRKNKDIYSTEVGKSVIRALPESVAKPDMTAIWENKLEAICNQKYAYPEFMNTITNQLKTLLDEVSQANFSTLRGQGKAASKKRRRNFKPKKRA